MTKEERVVEVEMRGAIAVITLNRPKTRNAVNRAMNEQAVAAMDAFDRNPKLRVAILTGAGGTFCSGMDLKAFVAEGIPSVHPWGFLGLEHHRFRKPVIAAVEGDARAGGFEAALACDLIVAARDARLGLSEVKRGLAALGGGLFHLPRKVPVNVAMEMALTGEPITGERGYELGLVNRLCAPGDALAEALALAGQIAANSPLGVEASKAVIASQHDWSFAEKTARQQAIGGHLASSRDAREGALAFAEKRPPKWQGR